MKEIKYNICDEVFFLNTSKAAIESVVIRGAQIIPLGISKDENGKDVLDGDMILYKTEEGVIISENELFPSREACRAYWAEVLDKLK